MSLVLVIVVIYICCCCYLHTSVDAFVLCQLCRAMKVCLLILKILMGKLFSS